MVKNSTCCGTTSNQLPHTNLMISNTTFLLITTTNMQIKLMLSFGWPFQHHFVKRWPRFSRRPNLTTSIWSSWQLLPISNQLSLQNCKISFLLEYKSIIYPYISLGLRHCVVVRPFSSREQIRPSMGMLQAFSFNNGFFFIKLLITYQILWNIKLLYEQFLVNMCSYWEIWNVI